ncbi:MAG: hypothetical protein K2W95_25450 [Candidatus Obscuribacterales bacterium]|nr:hypothetical protein [Candidatus Obscuribacterales bacterium]
MTKRQICRQGMRKNNGQGLLEASCGTFIITTVFVFLLMLGLNTYAILTTDTKLRLICSEAAQVREEHTYFLGMKRVDFTDAQADQIAKRFAVSLAESNGIPITEENVAFHSDENTEQASTTCTVTLDKFVLPYGGGAFPSFLAREVSATVARMSVPAPAIVGFNGVSQEYGRISVKVPCYGGAIAVAGVHDPVRDLQNGTARQMADAPLGPLNCRRSFGIGVNADGLVISGPKNENGDPASNPNRRAREWNRMSNPGGFH